MKAKIGDWICITGSRLIRQDLYDRSFPQGYFGKVIGVKRNGSLLVRCYRGKTHPHLTTNEPFCKVYNL